MDEKQLSLIRIATTSAAMINSAVVRDLVDEIERLQAENERLRQIGRDDVGAILDAIKDSPDAPQDVIDGFRKYLFMNAPSITCSHCGLMIGVADDPNESEVAMLEHVLTCPRNPVVQRALAAEAELVKTAHKIDQLQAALESGMKFVQAIKAGDNRMAHARMLEFEALSELAIGKGGE